MSELGDVLNNLLAQGADPNDLQKEFEDAVLQQGDWALWGDGRWRPDVVCSKCGSSYLGICADSRLDGKEPEGLLGDSPLLHRNQPGVHIIPMKEWKVQTGELPR